MFKYKGVFFDAGNTLLRVFPSVGGVYSDAARLYGLEVPAERIEAAFRETWTRTQPLVANEGHRLTYEKEKDWWRYLVRQVFDTLGGIPQFDRFFDYLYLRFAQSDCWRLYDDVGEVLEILRGNGMKMALISNWDSRLPVLCDQLDITRYFDAVVVSALVGYEKPHPAIFQIALSRTGLAAEQVLYVGDDPFLDYQAARKAGLDALQLDRHGRFDPQPDTISSLTEVLARI